MVEVTEKMIEAAANEIMMLHGAGKTISEQARQILEAAFAAPAEVVDTPPPEAHLMGPQDISTAPKMTDVLVWWPIVQLDDDGEPTEEVVDGRWIISEDQGAYWIEPDVMNAIGDHLGDDFTYAAQPSHWMPLPAPLFVPAEDQL
ncbi:MAG: hypothetical protein ACK4P4_22265 [Allorhizobium sp.]